LERGLQHTDNSAVRTVLAFGKPAQAVEVTEELVGAVNEVNDHFAVRVKPISSLRDQRPPTKLNVKHIAATPLARLGFRYDASKMTDVE
jgi:hypothetical protein